MNINIKMDKDFENSLDALKKEFGEDFEILNGIHDSHTNFSDFIDGFIDKNVADVTIDANANASNKDIRSLLSEKGKAHDKLFAFNKIFYELKKKYGLKTAREWLRQEYTGGYYLHDAPSSSYMPYCFSGDTKIMTKMGLMRLDELVGQNIQVLNKYHGWEDATVQYFGNAELRAVTLERYGKQKTIMATGNHQWFVNGITKTVETDSLKPGDKIPFNTSKAWSCINPSPFGIAHGFFIGDGDHDAVNDDRLRANFCGDKTALLPYFTPNTICNATNNEVSVYGIPKYFKNLPALTENISYLYGFVVGFFAADGCIDEQGRCTVASTDPGILEYIRQILCILGMPVNEVRWQDRVSNLTGEMGRVYILTISDEYLMDNFFIRPLHIERHMAAKNKARHDRNWIVKSVVNTGMVQPVYCAVVPRTQSFTLDGNILTHNCYAYDLTRLAEEGLFFLNHYNAQPAKHLTTFLDDVIEYISYMSNRSSGAVGIPNVLVWTFYFWKKDCEEGYAIKDPDYYIRQIFQKLIYRLNQPFMRVDQTAFVNVSIFDRNYAESLFGGLEYPDGTFFIDYIDEFIEHEKTFMEVVSEIRSVNMFTFPVLTYSLLYKDGKFVDEEFARWCSDHNTKWNDSNFFVSSDVTTLSNCPMSGDTKVLYKVNDEDEYTEATIKEVYELLHSGSGINHIKVPIRKESIECRVNKFNSKVEYEIVLVNGAVLRTTANHLNAAFNKSYVETKDLTTDDKLLVDASVAGIDAVGGLVYVKIKEINKIDGDNESYCMEVLNKNKEPVFTLANGIVTHNCRLLSDTTKLSGFINSIGGTALSIGSVKVNTINLCRIGYETNYDEEEYFKILRDRTVLCCKALETVRHIIQRNVEKGLLPNYCEGGVEMDKQYCTVGILGLFEAVEAFGYTVADVFGNVYYTDEGLRFASRIFDVINDVKDNFTKDFSFNIESVPAERAAVILCQKDNLLYEKDEKFIYSNQWIPLSAKCTLNEKLRVSAILDNKCSGGAIAHINLESNFPNTDMAWESLNRIAQSGVIYFAYNTRINECKNHHGFVGTDICPECGEPVIDTYQRIVGYLVPSRSYSKDRFREFNTRKWYSYAEMLSE